MFLRDDGTSVDKSQLFLIAFCLGKERVSVCCATGCELQLWLSIKRLGIVNNPKPNQPNVARANLDTISKST